MSKTVLGYHGTRVENAIKILTEGFKLDAQLNRDPGDLGRGIYIYPKKWLAKMDECVLEVEIEVDGFLKLKPPKLTETIEALRKKLGCTIRGKGGKDIWKERFEASLAWRDYFLKNGYKGLLVKGWDTGGNDGYELVVFDLGAIKRARLVWVSPHSRFIEFESRQKEVS